PHVYGRRGGVWRTRTSHDSRAEMLRRLRLPARVPRPESAWDRVSSRPRWHGGLGRDRVRPLGQAELDLALVALDLLDADADGIAEPERPSSPPADERRPQFVQLEVVAPQSPRGQVALEDV